MNDSCVLIKKKEYEELKEQAESTKPDYINITIHGGYDYRTGRSDGIYSSINLSDGLIRQINSIRELIRASMDNNTEYYKTEHKKAEEYILSYRQMSFWQRLYWAFTKKNNNVNVTLKIKRDK